MNFTTALPSAAGRNKRNNGGNKEKMIMGMDFSGAGGAFSMHCGSWCKALQLARQYGWQPAGTVAPDYGPEYPPLTDWNGEYVSNSYQEVTDSDAKNLADALDRALADVPRQNTIKDKKLIISINGVSYEATPLDACISPLDYFSGGCSQLLVEIIALCRAGHFFIG